MTEIPKGPVWGILLFLACLWFLHTFMAVMTPFVIAIVLAYMLRPATIPLRKIGCSHTLSVTILVSVLVLIFLFLGLLIAPKLLREANALVHYVYHFILDHHDDFIDFLKRVGLGDYISTAGLREKLSEHAEKIFSVGSVVISHVVTGAMQTLNFFLTFFLIPLLLFYFLRDFKLMEREIVSMIPKKMRPTLCDLGVKITQVFQLYFRGLAIVMLVMVAYYCVAFSLVGVQFALVLGVLSGVLVVVPYAGYAISMVLACALMYPTVESIFNLWPLAVIFGIAQVLESFVLTPHLIGERVGLHPLWVLFALLGGGYLFGFLGIMFAIPIAACVKVIMSYIVTQYSRNTEL